MSLITNRKRPRGLSESFDQQKARAAEVKDVLFDNNPNGSNYNSSPGISSNHNLNLNLNIDLNNSNPDLSSRKNTDNSIYFIGNGSDMYENEGDSLLQQDFGDEEDYEDEDDDVVIIEERQISSYDQPKARRNNSDSVIILDNDAYAAYNMFNVNQETKMAERPNGSKKQRTNSLPQLPQAKCFYNKIPSNYIVQHPKMGNVKTDIIPHQLNLPPCDDKDGHYIIRINDLFANRFTILKLLGQGTFGKVVECYDKVNRETVAIKIIRNIPKYRDAAKIELRILSTLKMFDNENLNHCIHLRECFDYRGHVCIVTDLLKISLYDFLEKNCFISFPGSHIQAISKQLIRSVTFLHDLNLIHTDLKPENILLHDDSFVKKPLVSSTIITSYLKLTNNSAADASKRKYPRTSRILKDPLIQIIDFGSAIFNDEYHSSIVSTRHYRAPEIVLGIGWSFPCDMWSVGCILVEFVIGEPLFKTHDNLEHLAMIEKVTGSRIDKSIVRLSKQNENECGLKYFTNEYMRDDEELDQDDDDDVIIDDETSQDNSLSLIFPSNSTPSKFITSVNSLDRIDKFISGRIGLDINFDYSLSSNYKKNKHLINFGNFTFWWFFIDLLRKLFVTNPHHRITASEAMEHPWFNLGIEDEGTV